MIDTVTAIVVDGWAQIGFTLVPGAIEPFIALDRGARHPHLRAGVDRFEVVPTPQRDLGDERVDHHPGDRPN